MRLSHVRCNVNQDSGLYGFVVSRRSNLIQWLKWILADGIGWTVGFLGPLPFLYLLWRLAPGAVTDAVNTYFASSWADCLNALIQGAVIGGCTGILEWWIIRKQIPQMAPWVLATIAGYALGWFVVIWIPHYRDLSYFVSSILLGGAMGILAGCFQWIVLRRYFRQSGWWMLFSVVGSIIALGSNPGRMLILVAGFIYGAIKGASMVFVLKANDQFLTSQSLAQ